MNSRSRNLPWTFARSEEHFSRLARMPTCEDKIECKRTTISFSEEPRIGVYGKLNQSSDIKEVSQITDDSFELCARSGLQILMVQSFIAAFLYSCATEILHDFSLESILDQPVQDEPLLSEILVEDRSGHTSFSNILKMAPYRGWHFLNFSKLRNYVIANLVTHKEHV
jgi:hypothetical protein